MDITTDLNDDDKKTTEPLVKPFIPPVIINKPNGELASQENSKESSLAASELYLNELEEGKAAEKLVEYDDRGSWGGKLEFLMTCIGYAVGLGNVWRFPYLCYKNGGGAFLIPYVFMLGLVGLPLFFMELSFGQFASLGPIAIWKINPLFKGLGYAMVCVCWLIAIYYNVVISHVVLYLFASFASVASELPWISCGNAWNTPNCVQPHYTAVSNVTNGSYANGSYIISNNDTKPNITGDPQTPAEEYYDNFVLEVSKGMEDPGGINWKLALCLLLCWIIVLICLIRGIQSLGKVVYFTAIFPYVMLTIFLVRGVTLPGAGQGILFYVKPDFTKLANPRVWLDAATQIFYSLSTCTGGLVAMASYNKFENNCYKDALLVSLINCGTSIYSGFVIFSVLGFMAYEKGVDVEDVAVGGPGLAFIVYPEAISRMPAPQLWAICFFFMMATLGFGSQFSMVECVLSAFTDEFHALLRSKKHQIIFRVGMIVFMFFMGLPMVARSGIYLLNLVDYSVSGFPLLVVGVLEMVALNWIYGFDDFSEDIRMMLGHPPNIYWKMTWKYLSPIVIGVVLIFNCVQYKPPTLDDYEYPGWAQFLGWCVALFPMVLIPLVFLIRFCTHGGYKLMVHLMAPLPEWGPALSNHRQDTIYETENEIPLTPIPVESSSRSRHPTGNRFLFPPASAYFDRTVELGKSMSMTSILLKNLAVEEPRRGTRIKSMSMSNLGKATELEGRQISPLVTRLPGDGKTSQSGTTDSPLTVRTSMAGRGEAATEL